MTRRPSVAFAVLLTAAAAPAQPPAVPLRFPDAYAHAPSPLPDRVVLTWAGDPATTQAVTWRTDTSVSAAVAQLAEAEVAAGFAPLGKAVDGKKTKTVAAVTTLLPTDLGKAHYHSARFDRLKAGTLYVYRVGDGANWSEWFQFRTAAAGPAPLRFIYLGDAQNDLKAHWSRVVRGAYSDMPKAQFVLHAGDLINRGPADAEWGEWFAAAGWINGMVPSVPTPGNHEYSGTVPAAKPEPAAAVASPGAAAAKKPAPVLSNHWRAVFTLPENGPPGLEETAYFFDIQGVRIVSLNSNEKQAEQVPWLEQVLATNPHRWAVVTFHHPVYSTAKGRDNKAIRELWRPVFDRYGVDLVLQGHDHTYGRSGLMREDNLLSGATVREKGTVYAVSVSGPKMYSLEAEPWMRSSGKDTQLYQLVTVDGDRLHYEARTARGERYDEFELRKRPDGGNDLVERDALEVERKSGPSPGSSPGWVPVVAVAAVVGLAAGFAVVRNRRAR